MTTHDFSTLFTMPHLQLRLSPDQQTVQICYPAANAVSAPIIVATVKAADLRTPSGARYPRTPA